MPRPLDLINMLELAVQKREIFGKKLRNLRLKGWLPAIIYGNGIEALPVQAKYSDFEKIYQAAGENTLLNISLNGEKRGVLIYDVVKHFLTGKFLHADFYQVKLDEKIKVKIPLVFIGESDAVRNLGSILVKNIHEVEIEALPQSLPKELTVDISSLRNLGDNVKIKDLVLPPQIKILENPQEIIVLATAPRVEEEILETAVAEKEKIEAVKVESVEKKKGKEKEKELNMKHET